MRYKILAALLGAGLLIGCSSGSNGGSKSGERLADGTYLGYIVLENNQPLESVPITVKDGAAEVDIGVNNVKLSSLNTGVNCGKIIINEDYTHDFTNCRYEDGVLTTGNFVYDDITLHLVIQSQVKE